MNAVHTQRRSGPARDAQVGVVVMDAGDLVGDGRHLAGILVDPDQARVERSPPAVGAQHQHVVLAGARPHALGADLVGPGGERADVLALPLTGTAHDRADHLVGAWQGQHRRRQHVRAIGEHRPQLRSVADARRRRN